MTIEEKPNGELWEGPVQLSGPTVDWERLTGNLAAMSGSTTAQEALATLQRFRRLLNPIFMAVLEQALVGEPHPDNARVFSFIGSGSSDFTYMAEFRKLMGDDKKMAVNADKEYAEHCAKQEADDDAAHARGECTQKYGCQNEHEDGVMCAGALMPIEEFNETAERHG